MADTSDAVLAFVTDATPGTALGSGLVWQKLNFVSEDFNPTSDNVRSKVLRPDAALAESRRFSNASAGTLAMELARDPELETLMAAALRGAWVSNVLKAGVLKTAFAFEERITEGVTNYYTRYRGIYLGGFSLEATTDGLVDIKFPVSGLTIEDALAITTSATYTAAGTAPVLAGIDFIGLTNTGWTTPLDVEQMSFDLTNNLRADRKLGSSVPRAVNFGMREVTISWTAFFKDHEAFQKFKADGVTALSFGFTAPGLTSGFDFAFARARLTSFGKPVPGKNQTIKVAMEAVATFDATDATDFKVTRRT